MKLLHGSFGAVAIAALVFASTSKVPSERTLSAVEQLNIAVQQPEAGVTTQSETLEAQQQRGFIPYGVGERIDYEVRAALFGIGRGSKVGTAAMEVVKLETIRGTPTWQVQLRLEGSALLGAYSVNSVFSSWLDTLSLNSLRYFSDQNDNGKDRERLYDIYPERMKYKLRWTPDTIPEESSVSNPLDEASFLYFVRTTPLEVGKTYTYDRYFRPDRNPVVLKVLAREDVSTPAGLFPAIVLQPTIKTNGIFSEGGKAKIWLSDDPARLLLKLETNLSFGSISLAMTKYTAPKR